MGRPKRLLPEDYDVISSFFPYFAEKPMESSLSDVMQTCNALRLLGCRQTGDLLVRLRDIMKKEFDEKADSREEDTEQAEQEKKKGTTRSTQLSRDAVRQLNLMWGTFLGHPCDVADKIVHTKTVGLLQDRITSLTEAWSSGSGSWLKTIPILSFVIMQMVVLHCCVHFAIEEHESPPIIMHNRAESHYKRSADVIRKVVSSLREKLCATRKGMLNATDRRENVKDWMHLPQRTLDIFDETLAVLLGLNNVMPIIAVACEKYELQIINSWRWESGAPHKELLDNLGWVWRSPEEDGLPAHSDGALREIYERNPCELEKQFSKTTTEDPGQTSSVFATPKAAASKGKSSRGKRSGTKAGKRPPETQQQQRAVFANMYSLMRRSSSSGQASREFMFGLNEVFTAAISYHHLESACAVSDMTPNMLLNQCCDLGEVPQQQDIQKAWVSEVGQSQEVLSFHGYTTEATSKCQETKDVRNVQFQAYVLRIWHSLRAGCDSIIERVAKQKIDATTPHPRMSAKRKLDLQASRKLDADWGWERMYEDVFESTFILSLLASQNGAIYKNNCDLYNQRAVAPKRKKQRVDAEQTTGEEGESPTATAPNQTTGEEGESTTATAPNQTTGEDGESTTATAPNEDRETTEAGQS